MSASFQNQRRLTLQAIAALGAVSSGFAQAQNKPETLRIGLQKSSTLTTILRTRGTLEQLLAPLNVKVTWHEFTSGLPLL